MISSFLSNNTFQDTLEILRIVPSFLCLHAVLSRKSLFLLSAKVLSRHRSSKDGIAYGYLIVTVSSVVSYFKKPIG